MLNQPQILVDSIQNPKYQALFRDAEVDNTKYHPRQKLVGRKMLADYMGISLKQLLHGDWLAYGEHGKPYLRDHQFYFNWTNSYDLVVLVISPVEVGVDIERLRPFSHHRISRAFTADENRYLASLDDDIESRETLKLWTIKEATLKLVGTGLSGHASSVQIDTRTKQHAQRGHRQIQLTDLEVGKDYVGTLATYCD